MIDRLEATLEKYNYLQEELTKTVVLSDIKKTREYSNMPFGEATLWA